MILCAGEALIDMLPRKTATGETAFAPHGGGAAFNSALALGRLGARAGLLTGLSTDLFGEMLTRTLIEAEVDLSPAIRSDRPTTLAFVTLVDAQARYAFYDENTAGRMIAVEDLPALSEDVTALLAGGISLTVEPCGSAYEALVLREAGHRIVMLDPNIRPGLVAHEAAYRARLGRMIAAADIVKVSDEDLHWLEGPGDPAALARRLLDRGVKLVLLTRGAEGAEAFTGTASARVVAPAVSVADTVGAGDTFNAGFLCALERGGHLGKQALRSLGPEQMSEALGLAARAAAITVSRAGANPPWARELT